MKKLLIAFSMIGASALIACAADNGTPTTETIDWFEVTTKNPQTDRFTIPEGASWTKSGEKFEVESDLANLVSFEPTDSLTQKMAQVSFTLDAAIVPGEQLPSLTDKAKVAFAINEAGFNAWDGTDWVPLTGPTVPAEGASFDLLVEFDNRDETTKKVRFSVGSTALKNGSNEWITYSSAVTETVKVGFAGSGMITSFEGDQLKVTAEIIPVGDKGAIIIKEADLEKFKNSLPTGYTKVDAFIAADAQTAFGSDNFKATGITVGEAYALGLVAENKTTGKMAPVDGGVLKVSTDAQASVENAIPVKLNVNPPAGTGAGIKYQLWGADSAGKYERISDVAEATEISKIAIPIDKIGADAGKYRFFKVKAVVEPKKD